MFLSEAGLVYAEHGVALTTCVQEEKINLDMYLDKNLHLVSE
jgi:hypothetical protein